MAIEFRCTHCDLLLRTADGTSGKDALCPQCGRVTRIPEVLREVLPPAVLPAPYGSAATGTGESSSAQLSANPYQSPRSGLPALSANADLAIFEFQPTRIEIGDVFTRTWEIFKVHWLSCVVATWAAIGLGAIVTQGTMMILVVIAANLTPWVLLAIWIPLVGMFWLVLGLHTFLLKIARGQKPLASDLGSAGPVLLPAMFAGLLATLATLGGYLLLIVPGVILALMFSQWLNLIVDRRCSAIESLRLSARATEGNKLTLLALWMISGLAGGGFSMVTCGVGNLIVQPFFLLLNCVAYLVMTGQATGYVEAVARERDFGPSGATPG